MKILTLIIFFALLKQQLFAQDCDCLSNLNWVIETFQTNDAGYQMAITEKGKDFDQRITETSRQKAAHVSTKKECAALMLEWLHSFRPQHLGIQLKEEDHSLVANNTRKIDFSDWETMDLNVSTFKAQLSQGKIKPLEGIWQSDPYTIAIVASENGYTGIILEGGNSGWKKGEVKLHIQSDGQHGIYYLKDRSELAISNIEYMGSSHIRFNQLLFERTFPATIHEADIDHYIKSSSAKKPYIDVVNEHTLLLRIPSFEFSEKVWIDSVVAANKSQIGLYPNLIIDLTNNGGGSDASFEALLPLIYTGPIRTIQTTYYSTPFNIQEYKDYLSLPDLTESDRKMLIEAIGKLERHPFEFVTLTDSITEEVVDSIYLYPKQIAILINEGCASTTEQFLLAARQSRKVKLYGKHTMGVLDISNMKTVDSPCHDYSLAYSWTRSLRLPHYPIDDIGIQPDFFLDESIPTYQWIGYVAKKMAEE